MKKSITLFILSLFVLASCAPKYEVEVQTERDKKNKQFKEGNGSPIPYDDRKTFEGLNYYPIDSSYYAVAMLTLQQDPKVVKLKTSQGKDRNFKVYAKADFKLKGKPLSLDIYKAIEDGDGFSILFTDQTSGETTYEVGRYVDVEVNGLRAILDFNRAYNPYCIYDKKYDCPIPPEGSHLNIEVKAGEKIYKK
ncbi:DUF1684 domain-containing protein [Bernardetia sp. ABR2-2B]|uniref:DUF1684 domain-containing protein n=1 Tax=Bernardetia sp. ABR2-2B TaxID=3127472 RepID=UPI0030CC4095